MHKTLIGVYRRYFEARGMVWPDTRDALDFAVTEVGEAVDALKRQPGSPWVRHNEDKEADLGKELSQAVMMLVIAADGAGLNIFEETIRWMAENVDSRFIAPQEERFLQWLRDGEP